MARKATGAPQNEVRMTRERANQIGMEIFQQKLEDEGIQIKPSLVKQNVKVLSKRLGISKAEAAEFAIIMITRLYDKTLVKLRKIRDKK